MGGRHRVVRADEQFYADLDRQLSSSRGPNGEPSRLDFELHELPEIVDRFAVGFDDLPRLIDGRDDYRLLVSTGMIIHAVSVTGQLGADGSVVLVGLQLDVRG